MIKAIIIEDERIIAGELIRMLSVVAPDIQVIGCLSSVKESRDYLEHHDPPELIFADVQLSDGLSFEVFNNTGTASPVIFVTAYDQFIVNAFEHNGIAYLLKPVDEQDLVRALNRYHSLERHFTGYLPFVRPFRQPSRSRLIVKKGIENISIKTENIVLIYTEDKLVFMIDREGRKYRVEKNLSELEEELDKNVFFRANRQYIVNVAYIKSYKTYEKVKLQVDLVTPAPDHQIIVSQETAPVFRKWISEL